MLSRKQKIINRQDKIRDANIKEGSAKTESILLSNLKQMLALRISTMKSSAAANAAMNNNERDKSPSRRKLGEMKNDL